MEYDLVEADFQQYYGIDIRTMIRTDFRRYCRLLGQLPMESRFVEYKSPVKDWSWDREVQSRILAKIDQIRIDFLNANRGKGKPPLKADKQFQPDYVAKAKEEYALKQESDKRMSEAELSVLRGYFRGRNPKVRGQNE